MAVREPVPVRSYRAVVDDVERRIYRVDRWRLPLPGGVEVRAILYTVCAFVGLSAASGLPLLAQVLGALPSGVRYLALPVLVGWGLAAWRIDGRAPHNALLAVARFCARAKTLAGLRPTRPPGSRLAPVGALQIAPAGDEAVYRPGRVRGPARVILRYPARLEVQRARAADSARRPTGVRRVRVERAGERVRPLARGRELQIPEGAEVRFG